MIWGGSFSGKSHTLAYIKFLVQQTHGYKEDDIIELTVGAGIKNEFVKFHAQIMDGITLDTFAKTIRKFIRELEDPSDESAPPKIPEEAEQKQIKKVLVDEGLDANLATAVLWFYSHRYDPPEQLRKVWRWLCGRETTTSERAEIGVERDTKKDPDMTMAILSGYFTMHNIAHRGKKKTILFFDEMNNLTSVKDDIFFNCLRELTRKDNLTIVLAFSSTSLKKLQNIVNEHVLSHFPPNSQINLPVLDDSEQQSEITNFIKELISYHRDKSIDLSACIEKNKHIAEADSETLTEEFFPFTNELIKKIGAFMDQKNEPKRNRYPGSIMETLNEIVARGFREDSNTTIFTKAKILPDI